MASTEPLAETAAPEQVADPAASAFSKSVVISGIRCLLTYIVFPWLLPLLGLAAGVGPVIGIAVGTVAIGFNVASIRRFWASTHRWRVPVIAINVAVIALLTVLIVLDVADLIG